MIYITHVNGVTRGYRVHGNWRDKSRITIRLWKLHYEICFRTGLNNIDSLAVILFTCYYAHKCAQFVLYRTKTVCMYVSFSSVSFPYHFSLPTRAYVWTKTNGKTPTHVDTCRCIFLSTFIGKGSNLVQTYLYQTIIIL